MSYSVQTSTPDRSFIRTTEYTATTTTTTIIIIITACPVLAKEQCIKRHNRVCKQLHFNICKETGVQMDKKHWYEHVPK